MTDELSSSHIFFSCLKCTLISNGFLDLYNWAYIWFVSIYFPQKELGVECMYLLGKPQGNFQEWYLLLCHLLK